MEEKLRYYCEVCKKFFDEPVVIQDPHSHEYQPMFVHKECLSEEWVCIDE